MQTNQIPEVNNNSTAESVQAQPVSVPANQILLNKNVVITVSILFISLMIAGTLFVFNYTKPDGTSSINIDILSDVYEDDFVDSSMFTSDDTNTLDEQKTETYPGYTLQNDTTDYSQLYKNVIKQDGVKWYQQPIPQGDLKLMTLGEYVFDYFQLGAYNENKIIYVEMPAEMGAPVHVVFLLNPENKMVIIQKHTSADLINDYNGLSFLSPYEFEKEFKLNVLSVSAINDSKGILLDSDPRSLFGGRNGINGLFSNSIANITDNVKKELIRDTEYGPLYRVYRYLDEDKSTADLTYVLRLPGGLAQYFEYEFDFMGEDRVPQIVWQDGTANKTRYRIDGLGSCGGGGPEVAVNQIVASDMRYAGKTITGKDIYEISNPNHPLVQRIFEMTKGEVFEYNDIKGEQTSYFISVQDFINRHGVLIYTDPSGTQNIMTNSNFGPQAECGKPVVYLYPTATTTITVAVDALVTKSEPVYNQGWTATAAPNGKLVVGGQEYDSLFWDGYGNGDYPIIDEGFVVPTEKAMNTMTAQLYKMGFNDKEVSDFSEFWIPHLPKEKYTKFFWIQTGGMEKMAKLYIDPKPDTLLRAFVDFVGQDNYSEIAPQKLQTVKREGYVATEWGGVLRK
jgi:hypothetical protein